MLWAIQCNLFQSNVMHLIQYILVCSSRSLPRHGALSNMIPQCNFWDFHLVHATGPKQSLPINTIGQCNSGVNTQENQGKSFTSQNSWFWLGSNCQNRRFLNLGIAQIGCLGGLWGLVCTEKWSRNFDSGTNSGIFGNPKMAKTWSFYSNFLSYMRLKEHHQPADVWRWG